MLVDTGAAVSLVTKEWFNLHKQPQWELRPVSSVPGAVDGRPVHILGQFQAALRIGQKNFPVNFWVIPSMKYPGILGLDALHVVQAQLHIPEQVLAMPEGNIRLQSEYLGIMELSVAQMTMIPARTEMHIAVPCPGTCLGAFLTESHPNLLLKTPVRVAKALVQNQDNLVLLRIVNVSSEDWQITKGQKIATLSAVQGIVPIENGLNSPLPCTDSDHVDIRQQADLNGLVREYETLFSCNDTDLGLISTGHHRIFLTDPVPIKQPPRRIPPALRAQVDEKVQNFLDKGLIQPSASPWCSPLVLVRKRDGDLRFCIDYRLLNAKTVKDAFPLPRIDETLEALRGATWFSSLDLRAGYHQIPLYPDDRYLTAWTDGRALYEWNVLPMGLCNAPSTFSRLLEFTMAGLRWESCVLYLDDLIVYGSTWKEHLERLRAVFQRLKEANLKLNGSKCLLARKEIPFLGFVVSAEGIATAPDKIRALMNMPNPANAHEVRSILGFMSYYRRFVPKFSSIAAPLHDLTKKDVPFAWTSECQEALEKLKRALSSSPILAYPDFSQDFRLHVDASYKGLGAVLAQVQHGKERVISYSSRLLNAAERKYSTTELECLALFWGIKVHHVYLYGRKFQVYTDHQSLTWLKRMKNPSGRQARWVLGLSEYDFVPIHVRGKVNRADVFSRLPVNPPESENPDNEMVINVISLQEDIKTDPQLIDRLPKPGPLPPPFAMFEPFRSRIEIQGNSAHYRLRNGSTRTVVTPAQARQIFRNLHANPVSGSHLGVRKTLKKFLSHFFTPKAYRIASQICKHCLTCQAIKANPHPIRPAIQPIQVAKPMDLVTLDITGPYPETHNGNRYILVMVDHFSRYVTLHAMPNQTAETIANCLVRELIPHMGLPKKILTDQGRNFESALLASLCAELNIQKVRTSPYHPACNGMNEKFHHTLHQMLTAYVNRDQSNWDQFLPAVQLAYNSSQHESTGFTPFLLTHGYEPTLPYVCTQGLPPTSPSNVPAYVDQVLRKLEEAFQIVEQRTTKAGQKMIKYQAPVRLPQFRAQQKVWLHDPARSVGLNPKLQRRWQGPYCILRCTGPVNYEIQSLEPPKKVLVVHASRLKPYFEKSEMPKAQVSTTAPKIVDRTRPVRAPRLPSYLREYEVNIASVNPTPFSEKRGKTDLPRLPESEFPGKRGKMFSGKSGNFNSGLAPELEFPRIKEKPKVAGSQASVAGLKRGAKSPKSCQSFPSDNLNVCTIRSSVLSPGYGSVVSLCVCMWFVVSILLSAIGIIMNSQGSASDPRGPRRPTYATEITAALFDRPYRTMLAIGDEQSPWLLTPEVTKDALQRTYPRNQPLRLTLIPLTPEELNGLTAESSLYWNLLPPVRGQNLLRCWTIHPRPQVKSACPSGPNIYAMTTHLAPREEESPGMGNALQKNVTVEALPPVQPFPIMEPLVKEYFTQPSPGPYPELSRKALVSVSARDATKATKPPKPKEVSRPSVPRKRENKVAVARPSPHKQARLLMNPTERKKTRPTKGPRPPATEEDPDNVRRNQPSMWDLFCGDLCGDEEGDTPPGMPPTPGKSLNLK